VSYNKSEIPEQLTVDADVDKPARLVSRLVKVTKHDAIRYIRYGFLLVFYSNFVPKTVFEIFDL